MAWSALNAAVLRLGQFLITIVIARLVAPDQFGVFVVALTIYTIIVNVSEIGVGSAVVREVDRTRDIAPTVATIAIGTSAVLAGFMAATAPLLSNALGAGEATTAVRVMALTVLIGGAGTVPGALLIRDYQQKRIFAVDASVFLVSNGLLIVMATLGSGVMALAWSRVAGQLTSTVMFTVLAAERYRPGFDVAEAKRLLRFGLPLAGANLVGFTIGNVDFVVVGRLRGPRQLGLYNLAYNISGWPVTIFTAILNNVTLTTLSRVRESRDVLERHLSAALSLLAAASFPLSSMCAALALPLVKTVYGTRWQESAAALAVLAVFGSIRVIIALLSDLLVALGQTKRLMVLQLIWIATLVPAMIIGVWRWGIVGAGLAQSVVGAGVMLPCYILLLARSNIAVGWISSSVIRPLFAALLAGASAGLVARGISSPWLACLAGTSVGSVVYLIVLRRWLAALISRLHGLYGKTATAASGTVDLPRFREAPTDLRFEKAHGNHADEGRVLGRRDAMPMPVADLDRF